MQRLKICFVVTAAMMILFISLPAWAEPAAPMAPLKKEGMDLMKMQGKTMTDVEQEIPDKQEVGVPIYPGAMYVSHMDTGSGDMLPSLNLVASDPPERVRAWYRGTLEGWSYSDTFQLFYKGEGEISLSDLMQTESVNVSAEEGQALDLMFSDVPDVKSRIQITYTPAN